MTGVSFIPRSMHLRDVKTLPSAVSLASSSSEEASSSSTSEAPDSSYLWIVRSAGYAPAIVFESAQRY